MSILIIPSPEFKRQFKTLYKRYRSLTADVEVLKSELLANPYAGADLGGGARVITYTIEQNGDDITINLLTIYDKSETENLSDNFIKSLITEINK